MVELNILLTLAHVWLILLLLLLLLKLILTNFIRLSDLSRILLLSIIYLLLLLLVKVLLLDLMIIHQFEICHVLEILIGEPIQIALLITVIKVPATRSSCGNGEETSQSRPINGRVHPALKVKTNCHGCADCEGNASCGANEGHLIVF